MQQEKLTSRLGKECGKLAIASFISLLSIKSGVSAITIVSLVMATQQAMAAILTDWQYDPTTSQLEITLKDGTRPRYRMLDRPRGIVLDLPNTKLGGVPRQQIYSGTVRRIRVLQLKPKLTRMIVELSDEVVLSPAQVQLRRVDSDGRGINSSQRWVLQPLISQVELPPATFSVQQTPVVTVPPLERSRRNTDSVIQFGEALPTTTLTRTTSQMPLQRLPNSLTSLQVASPLLPAAGATSSVSDTASPARQVASRRRRKAASRTASRRRRSSGRKPIERSDRRR